MYRLADEMDVAVIRPRSGCLAGLACALALVSAQASRAADWALCTPSALPPAPPAGLQSTTIEADSTTLREDGVSVAEGNVILRSPERRITSHRMDYDAAAARVEASGEVTVREREMFFEGPRLRANLETGETILDKAGFSHPESHGRGTAEQIENLSGTTVFTDGSFTTCDPGSNAWRLKAKSLELDRESRTGIAHHARLEVLGVPVLYTPWISFPLGSERKSGLLTPSFGSSTSTGTTATLPLYLNLAPSYDATLKPRLTSRRGAVLGGQVRYLIEHGMGTFEAEGLPEDRITGHGRSLLSFRHRHQLAPRIRSRVAYARASDVDYLRDLGTGLSVANTDYLRRFAEVTYDARTWWFEAQVEDVQILKAAPSPGDPYRVVPRLALEPRFPERNRRFNFDLRSELSRFEHHSEAVASGVRADLLPSVSFPVRSSFSYFVPRATLRYTGYSLDQAHENVADTASRAVPIFSVDSGLFFDRELAFRERRLTQTLEPRLYYVRAAHRDQDHLPLFDTGSLTSGYDHMFRDNRFSGTDRIGDANRLTLALDTRLLDGGREVFEARLGQMRHFDDRRVRFCTTSNPSLRTKYECPAGDAAGEQSPSTWIAALKARPHRVFTIGGVVEHDDDDSRNHRLSLDLRYHPSPERIVNLGYRRFPSATTSEGKVQESIEEMTESMNLSVHRDFGRHLRALGSASYALDEDTFTDFYAGIEYDSCCWRVRILGQRYRTVRKGAPGHENSVLLQWELKGFTGSEIGRDRSRGRPIPGYRNHF